MSELNIPGVRVAGDKIALEKLFNAEAGLGYVDLIKDHGKTLIAAAQTTLDIPAGKIVIVDIPRGGVPLGDVAEDHLKSAFANSDVLRISSNTKHSPAQLFPENFGEEKIDWLVLTDGVVGSGATIISHLEQAPLHRIGGIALISNITSEFGAKAIASYANQNGRDLEHFTGVVVGEEYCCWQEMDSGKRVYYVGYNPNTGLDLGVPDFGDAIQPK